ncbi:MAG: hypothetical protein AAGN82_21935 [Myxococcota bacterium]
MRRRHTWLLLTVVAVALAVWRGYLVGLGPDPDSDAYGHHVIARKLLAHPGDHGVHWVWLPLFHWLQVPLVALGGTMQFVRYANVALWTAVPLVLAGYLMRRRAADPSVAALAGLFCLLCPIGMQMGTTGQPEPLFALLLVALAWSYDARRWNASALLLSAAVLTRYEAWAVLLAIGLHQGWRLARRKTLRDERDGTLGYASVVLVPGLVVLGWALMRWPDDGRLFGFVRDTRQFATEVHGRHSAFEEGLFLGLRDALYYAYDVARRVYGLTILLVPIGLSRTHRHHFGLTLVGGAALAFITATWLMRGTLGLDRHFVAVVPLYATAMAWGVVQLGRLARRAGRRVGVAVASLAAGASLISVGVGLVVWMGHWRAAIATGFRDRVAVAAYLRRLPPGAPIWCDEATVEVLSELDRTRFVRRPPARGRGLEELLAAARTQEVYVASWVAGLGPLRPHGTIVFRPDGATETTGLAVMVVPRRDEVRRAPTD